MLVACYLHLPQQQKSHFQLISEFGRNNRSCPRGLDLLGVHMGLVHQARKPQHAKRGAGVNDPHHLRAQCLCQQSSIIKSSCKNATCRPRSRQHGICDLDNVWALLEESMCSAIYRAETAFWGRHAAGMRAHGGCGNQRMQPCTTGVWPCPIWRTVSRQATVRLPVTT